MLYGLAIGVLLPLLAFPIITWLDKLIVEYDIITKLSGSSSMIWAGFKQSTLVLMAFCFNLIPTYSANKRRYEEFIRGIMIPTVIYCFIWFFYYWDNFM